VKAGNVTDKHVSGGHRFLQTEQDLGDWLNERGIDTATWGTGQYKSLGDLWAECQSGEALLDENPPGRTISVVKVIIRNANRVLVEVAQILANGERRPRNSPPTEKIKPGESVRQAALRCVREELGIALDDGDGDDGADGAFPGNRVPVATELRFSPSYPGLPTHYTFYECELDVPGLPDGSFTTQEAGDPVAIHFWEWHEKQQTHGRAQYPI
jgi:8-oxo-dGTP pyrophosphatase MutT (NUDIX family)